MTKDEKAIGKKAITLILYTTLLNTTEYVIPAKVVPPKAGQENTGFRGKPGMTRTKRLMSSCIALMYGLFTIVAMLTACSWTESGKEEKNPALAKKKESAGKKERAEKKEEPGIVVLSQEKQKEFGVKTTKATSEELSIPISATAVTELNADRISKISPRMSGKIVKVNASQGDRVGPNQPLAYLDSPEIDLTWADYLKTKSRLELAEKNLKREETLFDKRVSPERDVLKARQELKETEADLNLAKEKFRVLGINISEFEDNKLNGDRPLIPIGSSVSGTVIEKNVSQGEIVSPDKILFVVADLSTLWVVIDILEKDVGFIRSGMAAKVSVTAFPERAFRGNISYTGDKIDEKTRTAKARVTVDNSGGLLKLGMFATASIDSVKDSSARKVIAVPEEAVFLDGSERYVFLQEGDERFVARRVSVGPALGLRIEIKEGLKVGEAVVTRGVFTLKSELKKETLQAE
jgi:membrane fusion protein, heavy metal efflux system